MTEKRTIMLKGTPSHFKTDAKLRIEDAAHKAGTAVDNVRAEEIEKGYVAKIEFPDDGSLAEFAKANEADLSEMGYDVL